MNDSFSYNLLCVFLIEIRGNYLMSFFCEKIVWEYGEKYGHVFYPQTIDEFKKKVTELDLWGRKKSYPFLIAAFFTDNTYLAFTVSHDYSLLEFSYALDEGSKGLFYVVNPMGDRNHIVPIYYMSSYTEPDTTKMLPFQCVLSAVYHYVEKKIFPAFITFDDEEVNRKFVAKL